MTHDRESGPVPYLLKDYYQADIFVSDTIRAEFPDQHKHKYWTMLIKNSTNVTRRKLA